MTLSQPASDCPLCPRLAAFRDDNRASFRDWHNAPVPSFGALDAKMLVVGLAPGLRGANRTGRPFTGDFAGDTLYPALLRHGFATGAYAAAPTDGLSLQGCRITNAARCVPPQNKPLPAEIAACRPFLASEIEQMRELRVILALGHIAHQSVIASLGLRQKQFAFAHGKRHALSDRLSLIDSYHCSRYNTNTGVLTEAMFDEVIAACRRAID
jgi:uracil-DNA glycosylase family 4